ncbi:hypothetical protein O6H91_10G061900 [Diphasiastrum complanatum]|uniref:Uncharacterized protein n=1 Tax=Diphasiastrum complanatum TaxID=34168 RepID=A0ACC2CIK1_DIPCM|nr:hypothetical protein O6H91_10G061900 [Diphasiastrum complanatum]
MQFVLTPLENNLVFRGSASVKSLSGELLDRRISLKVMSLASILPPQAVLDWEFCSTRVVGEYFDGPSIEAYWKLVKLVKSLSLINGADIDGQTDISVGASL